jgi:hypothetical protein
MRHHPDALEYDFMTIGQDLLDVYRGTMSLRRACIIFSNLPDGCAVFRDMGGARAWSQQAQIAVEQLHAANVANWQRTKSAETGANQPEYPAAPLSNDERIKAAEAQVDSQSKLEAKAEKFMRRQHAKLQKGATQTAD